MAGSGNLNFSAAPAGTLALGDDSPAPAGSPGTLDFRDPPGGTLAFGTGGSSGPPPADLHIDADIGAIDCALTFGRGHALAADADIGALDCAVGLLYDINVARALAAPVRSIAQQCAPAQAPHASTMRDAGHAAAPLRDRVQQAAPLRAPRIARWQAGGNLRAALRTRTQQATPQRAPSASAFETADRLRGALRSAAQQGMPTRAAVRLRFDDTLHLRAPARSLHQQAAPLRRPATDAAGLARFIRSLLHVSRYQQAMRPLPGPYGQDGPPPEPPHQCYDPARLGLLVFEQPYTGDGKLVFVCHHAGGEEPPPPATIVVIRRRSYIVLTDLEVLRADTGQPLPALVDGFGMRLDRSSWTWDFSVNLHAAALPLLQPGADGLPRELEVRVNGQPFRMLAESRRRSTQHPRSVLRVGGRGKAALLDAPFADVRSFTQPAARTAQQLMLDALTINGVSIGWTVDWGLTDWPVPADTWAHHGTWISAINDIAASVGAYVQPHDTDPVLRILPGYPVRSWQLASATPDIELPPGIATVEEVEWVSKPAYDSLYLHGEPGTYMYFRKRAGTPGSVPAPMAVHPLLVHTDAAAQRAIAELSDTGRQVQQRLTLPVLPATGVIKPGQLLRYTDDADVVRTGVVRGVSVGSGPARIEQTLEVQAHE